MKAAQVNPAFLPSRPFPLEWFTSSLRLGQLRTAMSLWRHLATSASTRMRLPLDGFAPWLRSQREVDAGLKAMQAANLLRFKHEKNGVYVVQPIIVGIPRR